MVEPVVHREHGAALVVCLMLSGLMLSAALAALQATRGSARLGVSAAQEDQRLRRADNGLQAIRERISTGSGLPTITNAAIDWLAADGTALQLSLRAATTPCPAATTGDWRVYEARSRAADGSAAIEVSAGIGVCSTEPGRLHPLYWTADYD